MPKSNGGAASRPETNSRVSTGIEGLDDVLMGGFPLHHFYLIEGDPGAGKTTLALQFLLEGRANGEGALYVTLSETKRELREVAASHGWSLDGIALYELEEIQDPGQANQQYTVFHPSEVELSETTNHILQQVEALQPTRVVFDSLSELRLLARDALRYRRQILSLKHFFVGRRCTVLLLDDRTDGDDSQLQSISHGVLRLERQSVEYGSSRRRLQVVKMRGAEYRDGYHDFTIRTGGLMVYPRLVAAEHLKSDAQEGVSSGLAELDLLLGGGTNRGASTLFMGPAGAGKSTLVTQYAVAAADRGEAVRFYIYEESRVTFINRAIGLGLDLKRHLDSGLITVQQVDPAELSPGEFTHRVRQAVEQDHARMIVIDSLNGYLNAMPSERFLLVQMHELLTYLAQQGVITLLTVAQHGVLGGMLQVPIEISYLADAVVMLRFFEADGEVRQAISVVKKRQGNHERTIRELRFTAHGIRIGAPLRQFQGILTGVPFYRGERTPLLETE